MENGKIFRTPRPHPPTRREILGGLGGASVLALSTGVPAMGLTNEQLHHYSARKVVELTQGRNVGLKLLIPNGCGDNIAPVIAHFVQETGVVVSVAETSVDDINTQISLDWMSDGADYDVVLPATFGIPDLASSGALLPLDDYVAKHEPAGFRQDILFGIGDLFDNRHYGFQTDGDAYVMFYNDRFLSDHDMQAQYQDKFGTALDIPLTWEELDRQIKWFDQPDKDIKGGLLFRTSGYVGWEWWVRFHAKGVWPLSMDLVPQIDRDAGIEALRDMINVTPHLAPEVAHLGLFENWERYSRGDIYCNIGWGGSQKFLNGPESPMRGAMQYGPTPGGFVDGKLLLVPYFNWGWNYAVSAKTAEPEVAYLFSLFAASPEMSTLSVRQQGGYFDPFRPEHYEDPEIQKIYSREFLDVHLESLQGAIPNLYLANQSQYLGALNLWLPRALAGDVTPDDALRRVAQMWNLITARSDPEKQKTRWHQLRQKYPANVRDRLHDVA